MDTQVEFLLQLLLGFAVLAPLCSFWVILLAGPQLGKHGIGAGYLATFAIFSSFVLSTGALGIWLTHHWPVAVHHSTADAAHADAAHADDGHAHSGSGEEAAHALAGHSDAEHGGAEHGNAEHGAAKVAYSGSWYKLGQFGSLKLEISYYIDALTVAMFCMVTLIATCIHFYAQGYMHDELHEITDHEVTLSDGHHLHRPGRYHRFFQALSLFCFSMLGLVVAGNVAMTFVFWELVGICSYFLIGFYVERKSASTAANKAFIVNRVGDFGMILGLMALWSGLGTFDYREMFAQVRPEGQSGFVVPVGMIADAMPREVEAVVKANAGQPREVIDAAIATKMVQLRETDGGNKFGYGLLILAGIGIFCGCVGKSAQFPLHVWLPDAMEGPTPVSALVHSATMVAAGVFLVARFYPMFVPEVLLVIAVIGTITLFLAATIAITATDIKRVLAYSTVSQLGYMMLALGVGGWLAGVLHLFTHAFFKSLLFMCSGSVIHAVHTNDMRQMGGLRRKMPFTAYTMLVGCLAIAGAGIPFLIGFSGYYSKDAILEQALLFQNTNGGLGVFFFVTAAAGASITAFYMFRLWFMTFAGQPRDKHRYDHAHESPPLMYLPLVVLSVLAVGVAWGPFQALLGAGLVALVIIVYRFVHPADDEESKAVSQLLLVMFGAFAIVGVLEWGVQRNTEMSSLWSGEGLTLANVLESARPERTGGQQTGAYTRMVWQDEHLSHEPEYKVPATLVASATALAGFLFAVAFYGLRKLDPEDVRRQFAPIYSLLVNKWWFDELYDWIFVRPTHWVSKLISQFDLRWIDGLIHLVARATRWIAEAWDRVVDRTVVDGSVNQLAKWTMNAGLSLRKVQTGQLRQYVMFIVLGTVVLYLLLSVFWSSSLAR
ncbi:MAG: NADH-quinone oxidoreductase subunit L [Pirellulales bacterium]